jgi:outer membrane lipoprotein LolB
LSRYGWVLALVCLLPACMPRALKPDRDADVVLGERLLAERESQLRTRTDFEISGRIAISDGKDGGSGRFEWQQRGAAYSLRFIAPVSGQSWRLEVQPGQALLIESNGAVRVAGSAESLLARELNWHLPADAMRYWVLGMRAPRERSEAQFTAEGVLARLQQSDWDISYVEFDQSQTPPLPRKLFARSGDHQVRVSVRSWTFE